MYGFGFQTWEYRYINFIFIVISPAYALRSYSYLIPHIIVGEIIKFFTSNKIYVFYGIRIALALFSTISELTFINGINYKFGKEIGFYTLLFLIISSGMFTASTAYLPSTFAMYMLCLSYGNWYKDNFFWSLFYGATAVCIGWPFVGVVFIPIGLHISL